MGKFELTFADGTTKTYSRKIDATRAGEKADDGYRLTSPRGEVVVDTIAEAQAAAAAQPAKSKAAADADTGGRHVVGTFNADDAPDRIGNMDADAGGVWRCTGTCGQVLPVRKFPTTSTAGVRAAECRTCRNTRTKAAKAARQAANA